MPKSEEIVAVDQRMCQLLDKAAIVARSNLPVVIHGETGTGKDLLARRIHSFSPRAARPFIAVNCAAIPHTLLESEIFGHCPGAFSRAVRERAGLLASAHRGTILLDEIDEMDLMLQAKLLRVLQSGEIRPVGTDRTRQVDVRVIATTRISLPDAVAAGRFSSDLLNLIDGITLFIPALRERTLDISELAQYFLRRIGGIDSSFSDEALHLLSSYKFPGNVRELEKIVRRAFASSSKTVLGPEELPIAGLATSRR